jgi:hypothetical protein
MALSFTAAELGVTAPVDGFTDPTSAVPFGADSDHVTPPVEVHVPDRPTTRYLPPPYVTGVSAPNSVGFVVDASDVRRVQSMPFGDVYTPIRVAATNGIGAPGRWSMYALATLLLASGRAPNGTSTVADCHARPRFVLYAIVPVMGQMASHVLPPHATSRYIPVTGSDAGEKDAPLFVDT